MDSKWYWVQNHVTHIISIVRLNAAQQEESCDHSGELTDYCAVCGVEVDDRPGWGYCSGGGPDCGDLCPECKGKHSHNTYHVETLQRHPWADGGQTYENSFCGGLVVADCATWEEALERAKEVSRRTMVAYATERRPAEPGSSARPVVQFQAVRSSLDDLVEAEGK